ncbi:MAG: hypothetical protein OXI60_09180 [Acidiferrobacterales bacterium]|nr:hypothetical protein [Acidiferrobacterales bacterium]
MNNRQQGRIGFVWPGGGAEHDFYRFLEETGDLARLYLTCTRVGGDGENDHDVDALHQTSRLDWLVEAALRLIPLRVDCVYWPCTSGSFIRGREHAEAQLKTLTETVGVPSGSTSLAFIEALRLCNFTRVSVLSTYPKAASEALKSFLGQFDVEVLSMNWLNAASGWDAALFEPEFIIEHIPDTIHPDAEVLLIPDTAMPTLFAASDFEKAAGIPVFTANGVTMWNATNLAGLSVSDDRFGSLISGKWN